MDQKQKILAVDDDVNLLASLKRLLRNSGYKLDSATNGKEALEKVAQSKPDIILSDWMMPVMDGIALCQAIKSNPETRKCYFVFLSTKHDIEDKIDGLTLGADAYLGKPFHKGELFATLQSASRICALQRELEHTNNELNHTLAQLTEEMDNAKALQHTLLPASLPNSDRVTFASRYLSATSCSGDYYDVIALSDNRLALVMVDVCGHGVAAMVVMSIIRTLLHQVAHQHHEAGALLSHLNSELHRAVPTGLFATAIYGIYSSESGILNFANAGHLSPLLIHNQDRTSQPRIEHLAVEPNFPLNVAAEVTYQSSVIELPRSSSLMLYTDGAD